MCPKSKPKQRDTPKISTEAFETGEAIFTGWGESRGHHLTEVTVSVISQTLAEKLLKYAADYARSAGLQALLQDWDVIVGTAQAELPPEDRYYYVTWKNKQGTAITLTGILLKKGEPFLSHGFSIET